MKSQFNFKIAIAIEIGIESYKAGLIENLKVFIKTIRN
jgi:hypothetical protein